MNPIKRRQFIQRIGLSTGSLLLASIANNALLHAQGTPAPKRVVFVLWSNGLPTQLVTPQGKELGNSAIPDMRDFPWPKALAPLAPYRNRTLIIDNLANRVNYEHSTGYGALSGLQGDVSPGGITIDQYLAGKLGANSVFKSLNWGVGNLYSGDRESEAVVFASGPGRPLPHIIQPATLFRKVFADTSPDVFADTAKRRALMIAPVLSRLKVLNGALAPTEQRTVEHYTATLEDYDKRLKSVSPVSCSAPTAPGKIAMIEDRVMAMNEMAILAVACGMTPVVGVSLGCGYAHSSPLWDRLAKGTRFESEGPLDYHGHPTTPVDYADAMTLIMSFVASQVARMAEAWSKIPEGNGTVLDNTTIVMLSDSGGTPPGGHHRGFNDGWPVVVLGNAGGALKADGRFFRYENHTRTLGDFYSSLATASGVPTNDFGKGGLDPATGPLPEIMA